MNLRYEARSQKSIDAFFKLDFLKAVALITLLKDFYPKGETGRNM